MIRCVMTLNLEIWDAYGKRAVHCWLKYWPDGAQLHLYVEDFELAGIPDRLIVRQLPAWHTEWKLRHNAHAHPDAHGRGMAPGQRGSKGGPYNYRRDCWKFSHKIAALTHAAMNGPSAGVIIMLDADVITHAPVSEEWLGQVFPATDIYCAWLDRERVDYPECGFVMFRADHQKHHPFMATLRDCYETDKVFIMSQTHDSFVLMQMVEAWGIKPYSLSGQRGRQFSHPFPVSILGERLDHLKGKRKAAGRTPPSEAQRSGGYWE